MSVSTIPGFTDLPVSIDKMLSILHYCQANNVSYGLGCKVSPLTSSPPSFIYPDGHTANAVDCSGFHRYLIWHALLAAGNAVSIPDGSSNQNDWYAQEGYKHHVINEDDVYFSGLDENYLYACFCREGTRGESIGHVWFIHFNFLDEQWWTIESHGGVGPNSRPAQTPILTHICTDVYPIYQIYNL